MNLFSRRPSATDVVRIEFADLVAALSAVLPAHVPMTKRPDPTCPEDILLEWRPRSAGASILDVAWEASGVDIQFGFSTGYFDLFGPASDQESANARLDTIIELAEAVALGRMVTFTETSRKTRVETTVFGRLSGPHLYRVHARAKGTPDTYKFFAPW